MKAVKLLEKEMKAGVDAVLKGTKKSFSSNNINPEMIDKYMVKLGLKRVGEFETNGWDYDWWLHYTKDEKNYIACGGGYYGHFEFSLDDEE